MTPARGFEPAEYCARLTRAQAMMENAGLDALLLSTEPEIRYFTGFLTRFWESPTRPWFVVVPALGDPVAVIPAIGEPLMARRFSGQIRTWNAPDYADDGVTLLADALCEAVPGTGRIGLPSGMESHLGMPLASWQELSTRLGGRDMEDDANIMRRLRMVKSPAEIAKIRQACTIATRAFDRVAEIAAPGTPLSQVFRRFQMLLLEEGADWVSYLAGGAGPGGYGDVISPATDTPLVKGDALMLDTGAVWDGYFCDFDRNWSLGTPDPSLQSAHARLVEASNAAFEIARPGTTAAELHAAMANVLGSGAGSGRLGHGLGMQLTEWPSLIPADQTVLEPGMVLTLEPGLELAPGRTLVHEENIVVTESAADFLSCPAPPDIPVLEGT